MHRVSRTFARRRAHVARGVFWSVLLGLASSVHAADEAVGPSPSAPASSAQTADLAYRAAIKEGDQLFLSGQFAGAEQSYRRAVERQAHTAADQSAVAHARLAVAQRAQGKFDEALATLERGLGVASTVTERAKLVFLQADIHERQRALSKATERWSAYLDVSGGGERTIDLDAPEQEVPVQALPGEVLYPATAHERLKQVAAAEKRFKQYAAVKERIKKREAEADAKARKAK